MTSPVICFEELAVRGGTYPVVFSFVDEAGEKISPNLNTTFYTLTDLKGEVINGKKDEPVGEADEMLIILLGDDLEGSSIPDKRLINECGEEVKMWRRCLTVSGMINSDIGTNLPVKREFRFWVVDITEALEDT